MIFNFSLIFSHQLFIHWIYLPIQVYFNLCQNFLWFLTFTLLPLKFLFQRVITLTLTFYLFKLLYFISCQNSLLFIIFILWAKMGLSSSLSFSFFCCYFCLSRSQTFRYLWFPARSNNHDTLSEYCYTFRQRYAQTGRFYLIRAKSIHISQTYRLLEFCPNIFRTCTFFIAMPFPLKLDRLSAPKFFVFLKVHWRSPFLAQHLTDQGWTQRWSCRY